MCKLGRPSTDSFPGILSAGSIETMTPGDLENEVAIQKIIDTALKLLMCEYGMPRPARFPGILFEGSITMTMTPGHLEH